jgi:hypothetical protein
MLNTQILARAIDSNPNDRVLHAVYRDAHREDFNEGDSVARRALAGILRPHRDLKHIADARQLVEGGAPSRWVCLYLCADHCPRRFNAEAQIWINPGWDAPTLHSRYELKPGMWWAFLGRDGGMSESFPPHWPAVARPVVFCVGAQWLIRAFRAEKTAARANGLPTLHTHPHPDDVYRETVDPFEDIG